MKSRSMALVLGILVFAGWMLVGCQPAANGESVADEAAAAETAEDSGPTLYERLGGIYNIALVCDDLIERLAVNDALNENEAIAAARVRERFPGLKYNLTAMVCQATGGPCTYTGMPMKDSHANLNISEHDWEIFEADCKATFDKFGVPEAEQGELFAIIRSTKGDIVVAE